jgi:hypothetical protein
MNLYVVSDTNDHITDPAGAQQVNILTILILRH